MARLVRPVTPAPDEHISGLVARAAGLNVYPHATDVLKLAGMGAYRPETLPIRDPETAIQLADILGTTPDKLRPLYYLPADHRSIEFFGVKLRSVLRETRKRRVSPRALQNAAYIRAVWSVRPLSFDPATKEMLIAACPVCGNSLGFSRTWGVEFCEHCLGADSFGLPASTVDLRDFPQPLVEVNDVEALDFVTDLVNPMPVDTDRGLARLPDEVRALGPSQLFELILVIASALDFERNGQLAKGEIPHVISIPTELSPSDLARAGRTLMDWPKGFHALCEEAGAKAGKRDLAFGYYKEFGAFSKLPKHHALEQQARELVDVELNNLFTSRRPAEHFARKSTRELPVGDYVCTRQIIKHTPVSQKIIKRLADHPDITTFRHGNDPLSPFYFWKGEIEPLLVRYLDMMSEASVGVLLGLPPDGVRDCKSLYFAQHSGIAAEIAGEGNFYSKRDVTEFADGLQDHLVLKKPPKGYVRFSDALLMFPAGRRPWQPLIEAMIFEPLDAVLKTRRSKNILSAIWLKDVDKVYDQIRREQLELPRYDIDSVSTGSAILMLGISNYYVLGACVEAGLIEMNGNTVGYQSALDFASRFIFANEAAVRSGNSSEFVGAWLKERDVFPAHDFQMKGGVVYDREKVEEVLG
ncbi:hypothetical protein NO932_02495 [Pelagibacterium sp. 26DY04]|uniref:hypothetical protein n=1 Tax=Pelagibacterium sp. 26DY04 TaxID=2967130 RepID=UPI0028164514|nr:hypothetical protein [Pelagibacterium sp. 26DY04]WMT87490.1 hypothetical protein NO932_02495 [Pelagibacterium sp. 26DY04]